MLYFRMILTTVVSLYTSRVVLNVLGVQDFGTYNLVGGVVTMFGFFSGAMGAATQRFLSFDIGKNDVLQLRRTFNAAQVIHFGIALFILVLAETFGLWFVSNHLNLPDGRMNAVLWVYHFSVLSFVITMIQVPYHAIVIARERMNIYAYFSILEVILKLILVFMLTTIEYDKLKLYAILVFIVSFLIAIFYRFYTLRHFSETQFQFVKEVKLYKKLISYSGWNLFGGVAAISKVQGVSILLNIFFGTVVNAAQGIANQVSGAVNILVSNFQMASNPQIIKSYAAEDKVYMNSLVIRTSKFSFYLLFILILPVIIEIDYVLKLWLKIVPEFTQVFTVLILINALIDTISGPLMTSMQATGKVKIYQIVVGTLLILILPLSYFLFQWGFPPASTFIVSISISLVALAFRLLLTRKHIPEFSVKQFVQEVIIVNIPVIIISTLIPIFILFNMEESFLRLLLVSLTASIVSIFSIYLIGLKGNEKAFVIRAATALISKFNR